MQKNVMFGHIGCTSEAVACTFGNQLSMVDNPRSFAVVLINARGQSRRPAGGFRKTAYLCILNNSSFKKKLLVIAGGCIPRAPHAFSRTFDSTNTPLYYIFEIPHSPFKIMSRIATFYPDFGEVVKADSTLPKVFPGGPPP